MSEFFVGRTSLYDHVQSVRRVGLRKRQAARFSNLFCSVDNVTVSVLLVGIILMGVNWRQTTLSPEEREWPEVISVERVLSLEGRRVKPTSRLTRSFIDVGKGLDGLDLSESFRSSHELVKGFKGVVPPERSGVGYLVARLQDERSARERRTSSLSSRLSQQRVLLKVDTGRWEDRGGYPPLDADDLPLRSVRRVAAVLWARRGEKRVTESFASVLRAQVAGLVANATVGDVILAGLPYGQVRPITEAETFLFQMRRTEDRYSPAWKGADAARVVIDTTVSPPWQLWHRAWRQAGLFARGVGNLGWVGLWYASVLALLCWTGLKLFAIFSDSALPPIRHDSFEMYDFAATVLADPHAAFGRVLAREVVWRGETPRSMLESNLRAIDRAMEVGRVQGLRSSIAVCGSVLLAVAERPDSELPAVIALPQLQDVRCVELDRGTLVLYLAQRPQLRRLLPGVPGLRRSSSLEELSVMALRVPGLKDAHQLRADLCSVLERKSPEFADANADLPERLELFRQARAEADRRSRDYFARATAASHVVASIAANWFSFRPGEDEENCAICMDPLEEDQRVSKWPTCQHVFHVECAKNAALNANTCPLCRAEVEAHTRAFGRQDSIPALFARILLGRHIHLPDFQDDRE